MPPKQLDVLIIEDTEDDALLMVRELRRGGYDVQFDRVETASTLITAYESQKWDVILSDFALPGFNAIEALKLIRERDADIPFILLSGTVGEDIAVQAMRAGAQDFFAKDKLTRLVPAIERELSDAEHRRKRRWAEQELRQSEERFTRAFQSSPVAISISTVAEGILLDVNMQYLKLFGYGREEVIGHSIHDLNIWDAYSRRREIIQLLSSHSTAQNQDLRLRTKTGDVLECLVSFEQIDLGNELCILAMITDITDRKRAEEEIAFQAKLLNAVGQSVIATDLHGKIIYWNRAAKQLYGWTFEEVKGRNIVDVTPTEASLDESREIMSNLARGEIWQGEMLLRRSDDTTFPSLITNAPIHDKNGELIGIIGVSSDITKMKESEQAVRESERFARSTLDALSAHIAILDNTGTVIAVNQSWIDFATDNTSNAPKSAFLGVNYLETCDRAKGKGSEEAHAVAAGIRAVIGGQSSSFVLEYPCHSPSEQRWFLVRVTRFRGAGPVQIVVAHENITERKLAEEATKQYAKRLQLLHEIDQAILRADQPQSIALATLTAMHNVLDFHSANVTTFDLERQLFTVLATTASIPAKLLAGTSHPLEDISVIERLQQNEVYGVRDLFSASQVSSSDQALIDVGIRSYTRIPLISNQKLIGSINFRSENAEVLSEDQLKIAREVASQLAIAIENARLLEIEQQRTSELTALHQASLQLTRTLDMQTVLDTVLDYAILLVNANDAHIFLYDGNALTFGAAQWDVTKQNTPFAEPRPEGLTYTVARTGQRLVIPSVNEHPTYKNWQWNGAIIGLPLMATNEVKGVMSLAFTEPHHFEEHEVRVLELLADQAALAIHNVQLFAQITHYADELERIVEERTIELLQSKERVEAILASTSDMIILADQQGNVLQANPAFYRILQVDSEVATHNQLSTFMTENSATLITKAITDSVDTGQTIRLDITCTRSDEAHLETEFAITPIITNGQSDTNVVCIVHDITQRKQIENSLRNALKQEKELNELKSRFTSMVSHEFRTPLAVILSSAGMLMNYADRLTEEKRQSKLSGIEEQVHRLVRMLDDILSLSRSENVALDFSPALIDLSSLCENIVFERQQLTGENKISYIVKGDEYPVLLDAKLTEDMLRNLLSNAIKYSPERGMIEFRLIYEERQITLQVEDQGIGIPEEDQKRLFETFHRASNVGNISGTGLGLAIVERAVNAHKGTISVESAVGVGTTFSIKLPTS